MANSKLHLGEDLEYAIVAAIIKGAVGQDVVQPTEVSKTGRVVLSALRSLVDGGTQPPFSYGTILLTATDVLGAPKDVVRNYLQGVHDAGAAAEVGDILRKVRDKQLLVEVINEAAAQLQKGNLDTGLIGGLLSQRQDKGHELLSISERVKDGLPDPPKGLVFRSLPKLFRLTGGIIGVWVVAGQPGVGKSTLSWQLALDVGKEIPILYYDFENGFGALMDHTREIYNGDLGRIRTATSRIYHRDSIRSLDSDLGRVPAPALIVVDSIQKLPGSIENRRHGLDRWIHRLEYLKKRGYYILFISEVGRAAYDADPSIGAFKETGEIEYSADVGIQMVPQGIDADSFVELHIVKNRHKPHKGLASHLQRKRSWVFREVSDEPREDID